MTAPKLPTALAAAARWRRIASACRRHEGNFAIVTALAPLMDPRELYCAPALAQRIGELVNAVTRYPSSPHERERLYDAAATLAARAADDIERDPTAGRDPVALLREAVRLAGAEMIADRARELSEDQPHVRAGITAAVVEGALNRMAVAPAIGKAATAIVRERVSAELSPAPLADLTAAA